MAFSPENRQCKACAENYTIEPEDFEFYEKMNAVPPYLCPHCRFKRRCQFRNERTLYNRTCDKCHTSILSMFCDSSPYTVYCLSCYDSDDWDPKSYACEYDAERPFFEQFDELLKKVPKKALGITGTNVNSDYTNMTSFNKNCYLLSNASYCEVSLYSRGIKDCRDTVDAYFGVNMERCYDVVNVNQSAGVAYGQNATSCIDSWFLLNCADCVSCFGCVNLRHKNYCWFNEQLTKEEYGQRLADVSGSYKKIEEMRKKFEEFALTFPRRENNNLKSEDCTGDYLVSSKGLRECFEVHDGENSKYMFSSKFIKDSYDTLGYGYGCERLLDCVAPGLSQSVTGSYWVENGHDDEYCFFTLASDFCFGCDGLKKSSYCILNKQYDEKSYIELRERIIRELSGSGDYGLFFPPRIAPFAYNETIAQDYFPLTKEQALAQGYRWEDNLPMTTGKETILVADIPDAIDDVPATITKEILACATCTRNYKITARELTFYKSMNLPLPRHCFNCRHIDRIARRGPMKLFERTCSKCSKEIHTTFAPERPEIVYCEKCYQEEVV